MPLDIQASSAYDSGVGVLTGLQGENESASKGWRNAGQNEAGCQQIPRHVLDAPQANAPGLVTRHCLLLLLCLGLPASADGQYAILGRQVACRDAPSLSAEVVARLDVADLVEPASEPSESQDWIHVSIDGEDDCFIFSKLLTPFDPGEPERALAAIVKSTNRLTGRMPFGRMAKVHGLFEKKWQGVQIEGSLEMELLELLVLVQTTESIGWYDRRRPDVTEWYKRSGPPVYYFEPGGIFAVRPEAFWSLHEKYAYHPWADSVAWIAAQQPAYHDCEGSLECWMRVLSHELEYIKRHQNGAHVPELLARLSERLAHADKDTCDDNETARLRALFEEYSTALGRVDHALARESEDVLYVLKQRCAPE